MSMHADALADGSVLGACQWSNHGGRDQVSAGSTAGAPGGRNQSGPSQPDDVREVGAGRGEPVVHRRDLGAAGGLHADRLG